MSATPSIPTKVCTACRTSLPQDQFYLKGAGLDPHCISCKKAARNARYQRRKHDADAGRPAVTREVRGGVLGESAAEEPCKPYIEPRKGLSFDLWESKYGRPLSEDERLEIKRNMADFASLLLEIGQK